MGAVLAAVLLVLGLGACGQEPGTLAIDTVERPTQPPLVSITDALAMPGQTVRVEGLFIAPSRGVFRMCDEWEQDDPPQCGDPYLIVQAVDPAAVDGLVTNEFPPRGEVTYSEEPIVLQGSVTGGVLLIDPTTPESGAGGSPENPTGTTTTTTAEG
ncbi:hypothetical protein B7486_58135 [cyanobacterium TDX16]|nr:hypothetical protein B7486_58135 [cyanobacterium TDX16]